VSSEQVLLVAAGLVALVALLLAVRAQRRASRAEGAAAALAERIALLESPATTAPQPVVHDEVSTFVITGMGADEPHPRPVAQPIDGRMFADIVARETVVKAASWTHGLRRALSPETRNRIRFQVRQETKRAGKERRAEMKQALREYRARERDGVRTDLGASVAEDVA
jgi:hypothetical protein